MLTHSLMPAACRDPHRLDALSRRIGSKSCAAIKYRAPDNAVDKMRSPLQPFYHQLWVCLTVHSTNGTPPLPFPLHIFFIFLVLPFLISTPLIHGMKQPVDTITSSLLLRTTSALVERKTPHGRSQVKRSAC